MKLYYVNVVLLLIFSSAFTDALILDPLHAHHLNNQPNCGLVCPRSFPLLIRLEVGSSYVYNLESNTIINVKETQSVGIKAEVEITAQNACEYSLQLRKVELSGIPNPKELSEQLESNPLQFGSFDGKIFGVCPVDNEEIWTLNIKKSIISALQMSAKVLTNQTDVHEDDFSGHCLTTYKPLKSDDSSVTIIEKSKTLNKCEHRRKNLSGFNSRSLSMITELLRRRLPIMASGSTCTQHIKDLMITQVSCTEQNTLSFQDNSIVSSSLNLKFVEKTKSTPVKTQSLTAPQSLYISRKKEMQTEAVESDVLLLLGTICSQVSGDNISPETTKTFHALVQSLKSLSESATERIDAAVKSGEICSSPKLRYLFISASAFAASDPSIQTIVKAYNNKEFSITRGTVLFSLIALKSKPTDKTISALLPLLESKETARPLLLGTSLLIKNFCETQELCEENTAVKRSVDVLLARLQNSDCNLERITSIKALENIIRKQSDSMQTSLLAVVTNNTMDSGVRVAAIQTLSKISNDNIQEKLLEILLKDTEEVDVRIAAYKSVVMSGPTAEQWEQINSIKDSKIDTYIKTHIKNLRKYPNMNVARILSTNPRNQFEEPNLPLIPIGITRNRLFSLEEAKIEADIIHPKGSLIPNWLTFNVKVPARAGVEMELLEISFRHVGLDAHIKKVMGRGIAGPEITLRIAEELMEFIEHIRDPKHVHNIILQLSVKIAGRNVLFVDTLEDIHVISTLLVERLRGLSQADSLDGALGGILLDSVVEVPTLNGFPMIIHLNDTVLTGVKASLNTEATDPKSKALKIRSNRSVLAELSAGLNLEVGNYRPGFEYRMQFSFTPFIDALIETKDNRILKAKLNLPKEKQSLVKLIQTTRLIDPNGQLKESNEVLDNGHESTEENTRCKDHYGLSICRVRTPLENSPVPNLEIYVSKNDKSMDAIELVLEAPPKGSQEMKLWTAKMNAVNSEVKRELSAELQLLTPTEGLKEVSLKIETPSGTHTARLAASDKEGQEIHELEINCPHHIELKVKHIQNKTGEGQRNVELNVDYKLPHSKQESIKLIEKISFNLKRNRKTKLINVSLFAELNSTQFPRYNSQIGYYTQLKPYQHSKSELTIAWNEDFKDKIRISHNSKMDVTEVRPFQMNSENAIIIEATPLDINYDFKLDFDISMVKTMPKHLKVELVGKDVNGREDKDIRGFLEFERTDSPLHQKVNASLKYPGRELAYSSEVKQVKDMAFSGLIRYQLQKGQVVTVQHKESITNPTKDFQFESESEVSYSYKPDKYSYSTFMGYSDSDTLEYKHKVSRNGKKFNEWKLKLIKKTQLKAEAEYYDKSVELKVDSIWNPTSADLEVKYGQKSYKLKGERVPKQSVTFRLGSTKNSRLKEFEIHISRIDKSSMKLLTTEGIDIKGYIDPISPNKRAHIQIDSPRKGYSHIGDIKYLPSEDKLIWDSKTNKNGQPFITIESQFSCTNRTYFIMKKIKSVDEVSKYEFFYDKGVYGLAIDSPKYTAFVEGENKVKKFGKLGFFDRIHNYEHTSDFNIENGVITIKSISNKEKETFTKLDAVLGLRQISNITLITPTINSQLIANPLGEKKTVNFNWISPRYDQKTFVEWFPRNHIKIESLSQEKVEPIKRFKIDAFITRKKDSSVSISLPHLEINVHKTLAPKAQYIFNTTLNGYNEIEEYDVNKNLNPVTDFILTLYKHLKSYLYEGN